MGDTQSTLRSRFTLKPTQVLAVGFLALILFGALLLHLPAAAQNGQCTPFIDCIFTAASAVCVTGLATVSTVTQWTHFGQVVILFLIQTGGIGFMTLISSVFLIFGKKITLRERMIIQESFNQDTLRGLVRLVRTVIFATLLFEAAGAAVLAVRFMRDFSVAKSIYMGVFHSVSAFCNAGFDIIGDSSIMPYATDAWINTTLIALIVTGGLGFVVWADIARILKKICREKINAAVALRQAKLHTKIVLTTTLVLILCGAALIFIFEYSNTETIGTMNFGGKVCAALFQSVTCRTAGFAGIPQGSMTYAGQLLSIILMFIGGSPSSTAGGIKTVTAAVLFIAVLSAIRGRKTTHIYRKDIPLGVLLKAITIFFAALFVVMGAAMLLTFTEAQNAFHPQLLDLLFESTSAFTTTGLTTGITPQLSVAGKVIISICMYIGRIGPISVASALTRRQRAFSEKIEYPEENVMVG